MPIKDIEKRRASNAERMRRLRAARAATAGAGAPVAETTAESKPVKVPKSDKLFAEALAAGDPKAVEAARLREAAYAAWCPAHQLYAEIGLMPDREARRARKEEYFRVQDECRANSNRLHAAAKALREEVEVYEAAMLAARPDTGA